MLGLNIANDLNIMLILGFVIIVQTIKQILNSKGKILKSNTWFLITILGGFGLAFIDLGITGFEDFNIYSYIFESIIYSAVGTQVYKMGKIGIKQGKLVFTKTPEPEDNGNNNEETNPED